jgi:Tol biopolymer transport system component
VSSQGACPSRPSPFGKELIAFVGESGECCSYFDIFTMRPDGSGRHQVTHTNGAYHPAWASDGRHILYERTTSYSDDGGEVSDIWIMDPDGSHGRPLVRDPANDSQPAWAPDGRSFVFTRDSGGQPQLYMYSFSDGRVQPLTQPGTWRDAYAASWSPDGRRIAFAGGLAKDASDNGDLFTVQPDGSGVRRLTSTPTWDESDPDWSPDGTRVLYARQHGYADPQLMTIGSSGGRPHRLMRSSLGDPAWSPDGRSIAATGIVIASSDGSHPRKIIQGSQPAWRRPELCR